MAKLKVDVSVRVTHCRPEWAWDVTFHAKLWQDLILVSFGLIKSMLLSPQMWSQHDSFLYIYFLNQLLSISLKELKMSKVVPTLTETLAERRQDLNPATAADLSVTFTSATWEVSCIFRSFLIVAGRFLSSTTRYFTHLSARRTEDTNHRAAIVCLPSVWT